ncbi:MAG: lysostaphin resistance A-like protein [Clostridium sp.]|uniref:CPBP family intramembrane glutamic endopeptidase n=1 Tax=Clostridium sp. TaxID=1506 RepID=UPI003F36890D
MWKYVKSIFFAAIVYLFFNICFAVVQIATMVGFHINPYLGIEKATTKAVAISMGTQISVITICADIFTVLCAFIIIQIFTKSKFKNIIKPVKFDKRKLGVVITVGLGCSLVVSVIASLLAAPFFKDQEVTKMFSNMTTPISIIGTVVVAPIAEEIIFRGILFNFIKKRTSNIIFAIIISSVTFGIAHGNGIQGIYASLLGVFLALIYLYTGSIFGDILVHMVANGTTVLQTVIIESLSGSAKTKFATDLGIIHIFIGVAICLFAWYFYKKQSKKEIKSGFLMSGAILCVIGVIFIAGITITKSKMNPKVNNKHAITHQIKKS